MVWAEKVGKDEYRLLWHKPRRLLTTEVLVKRNARTGNGKVYIGEIHFPPDAIEEVGEIFFRVTDKVRGRKYE